MWGLAWSWDDLKGSRFLKQWLDRHTNRVSTCGLDPSGLNFRLGLRLVRFDLKGTNHPRTRSQEYLCFICLDDKILCLKTCFFFYLEMLILTLQGLIQGFHVHNFYSLCRGEVSLIILYQVDSNISAQKRCQVSVKSTAPKLPLCRLTHKNDDYFRLQPLKEEEISFDPPIAVFHEFLTEAEMSLMKNQAMPDLIPAMVMDTDVPDGSGSKMSNERTQASGWLWDHDHPSLYRLSR